MTDSWNPKNWKPQKGQSAKRPQVDREGNEQAAFFNWLRIRHAEAYEHAMHIPNGGSRKGGAIEGRRLKLQGVKAGVPDIFIALPRGRYHGLWVEFKATPPNDSPVSKTQKEWVARLAAAGYRSVVCKGLDALMVEVEEYLCGEAPHPIT